MPGRAMNSPGVATTCRGGSDSEEAYVFDRRVRASVCDSGIVQSLLLLHEAQGTPRTSRTATETKSRWDLLS